MTAKTKTAKLAPSYKALKTAAAAKGKAAKKAPSSKAGRKPSSDPLKAESKISWKTVDGRDALPVSSFSSLS